MGDGSLIAKRNPGILIACEGISGSGKSKTINDLNQLFIKYGFNVKIIEWNSNRIIRKLVVDILERSGLLTPQIYSFFQWVSFLIDYYFQTKPYLKKNYVVVADRYIYTALTRNKVNGTGDFWDNILYSFVRKPDILLYHNTLPKVCYERIKERGKSLFHTNKRIKSSKLLKNKDLYYLKKLEREYKRLLSDAKIINDTNIYYSDGSFEELQAIIVKYIMEIAAENSRQVLREGKIIGGGFIEQ